MNKKTLFLVLVLLIAVIGFFFLPNDEKKIRNNLSTLAEYCSTEQQEAMMESLKKAALTAKLCTTPCKIIIESFKIDQDLNQKEIIDRVLMMKKQLADTQFSFHDTFIAVTDKKQATITTTLRLHGSNVTGRFTDAYELDIGVLKTEEKWLFSSFHVVEFMEQ